MEVDIVGKILEALGEIMLWMSRNKTEQMIINVIVIALLGALVWSIGHGVYEGPMDVHHHP